MKIEFINDRLKLSMLLNFLGKNFSWDKKCIDDILNNMLICHDETLPSGLIVCDEDNSELIGGMLFFNQGIFSAQNTTFKIINLSSWYVREDFRGFLPLQMIKIVTSRFYDSILTNYTPSEEASAILKRFGFENMPLYKLRVRPNNLYMTLINNKLPKSKKISLVPYSKNLSFACTYSIEHYKLSMKLGTENIDIIFRYRYVEKKLIFLKFKVKIAVIVSYNNHSIFNKYYLSIFRYIMLVTRSLQIDCYSFNIDCDKIKNLVICRPLIKTPVKDCLVSPLNSEISYI